MRSSLVLISPNFLVARLMLLYCHFRIRQAWPQSLWRNLTNLLLRSLTQVGYHLKWIIVYYSYIFLPRSFYFNEKKNCFQIVIKLKILPGGWNDLIVTYGRQYWDSRPVTYILHKTSFDGCGGGAAEVTWRGRGGSVPGVW